MAGAEPIQSLIDLLIRTGRDVDEKLAVQMLDRKEEALPYLIDIVKSDKYWRSEDEDECWAPIAAVHLLSMIKSKGALEALVYTLYNYTEEYEDWLTEDVPSLLARFGQEGFDRLTQVVLDRGLDEWARDAAARAIMVIAITRGDSTLRKRTVECLRQAISNEGDLHTRSLLVLELTEMKDKDSLQFIKSLFDRGMIHPMVTTYGEVEDVYSGSYDHLLHIHSDTRDPMDYFRPEKYTDRLPLFAQSEASPEQKLERATVGGDIELFGPNKASSEAGISAIGESIVTKRQIEVGRNDPCPCGSGKKYKKCCLKMGNSKR